MATLCAVLCLIAQSSLTLYDPMDYSPPGSSVHGDSPGKNTVVGCYALLQGIFPTQGLQADSLLSEPPGKPWYGLGADISGRDPLGRITIKLVKNYLLISATDAKLLNQFNPQFSMTLLRSPW